MGMTLALEKIEIGEATPEEARMAIAELLEEGSPRSLRRLYAALGGWTWKTLDRRRRDDELREWFDIIRRTSAALTEKDPGASERLRAFYDLIHTSISTSKVISVEEAMSREHVREILLLLYRDKANPTEKTVIAQHLGLSASNLTRILNLMMDARLVERTTYGKYAQFALTREGIAAAGKIVPPPPLEIERDKKDPAAQFVGTRRSPANNAVMMAIAQEMARRYEPHSKGAWHGMIATPGADGMVRITDLTGMGSEPASALNQVNVTTFQPTRTYEESMHGGLVKVWEKKLDPSCSPVAAAVETTPPVGHPKDFYGVMIAFAKEQSRAAR
jgi:predicted transcriptional regulator